MKEDTTTFEPSNCPHCGDSTSLVHLGTEPPREICGRLGCSWDGENLWSW